LTSAVAQQRADPALVFESEVADSRDLSNEDLPLFYVRIWRNKLTFRSRSQNRGSPSHRELSLRSSVSQHCISGDCGLWKAATACSQTSRKFHDTVGRGDDSFKASLDLVPLNLAIVDVWLPLSLIALPRRSVARTGIHITRNLPNGTLLNEVILPRYNQDPSTSLAGPHESIARSSASTNFVHCNVALANDSCATLINVHITESTFPCLENFDSRTTRRRLAS
jgi:hypothetical protein